MTTNASATNYTDSTVVHVLMSEEYFARMWLHVLLLLVVMVVGVPGNSMVIAVFFKSQRRKRYNSTQLLVLALAITDLSVCTLLVPFDLHRLRYFFSLQTEVSCDVFEYFRTTSISLSCFLLTSMAVERYRALCSDTAMLQGQDRRDTVLIISGLLVVALVVSSPSIYFSGIQARVVPRLLVSKFSAEVQEAYAMYSGHVLMFSCEYLDEHDHTVALRLFGLTSLVLFVGLIITTIVSYGKIYDKIRKNHISLRMALNKVAPISTASAVTSPEGRATEGIFTTASDHSGALAQPGNGHSRKWETQRRHTNGTLVGRGPFCSPERTAAAVGREPFFSPERTAAALRGRGRREGIRLSPPPEVSDTVTCSDENDIDVTVDKEDDDLQRRGIVDDVLEEVHEAADGIGLDPEAREAKQLNPAPPFDVGSEKSCVVRALPRGQPRSKFMVSFGPAPSYDIFIVSRSINISSGRPDPAVTLRRKRSLHYSMTTAERASRKRKRNGRPSGHAQQCPLVEPCCGFATCSCSYANHAPGPSARDRPAVNGPGPAMARPASASSIHGPADTGTPGPGCQSAGRTDCTQPVENCPMSPAAGSARDSMSEACVSFREPCETPEIFVSDSDRKISSNREATNRALTSSGQATPSVSTRTPSPSQATCLSRQPLSLSPATLLSRQPPLPSQATCLSRQPSSPSQTTCLSGQPPSPSHATPFSRQQPSPSQATSLSRQPPFPSQATCLSRERPSPSQATPLSRQQPSPSQDTPLSRQRPSPRSPTTSFRSVPTTSFTSRASGRARSLAAQVPRDPHSLRFRRQIRVAKILLMVTGGFLLCFLPFWALTLAYMVCPHLDWRLDPVLNVFVSILYQSYFINNALNPVLFALYSPEFRKECAVLLKNVWKKFGGNPP